MANEKKDTSRDAVPARKESVQNFSLIAEKGPILIEHTTVPNPSKTDIEILKALKESALRANEGAAGRKDSVNVHELLSLNNLKKQEGIPYVGGNINNSIQKLIDHGACYPYVYLAGENYIIVSRIVLIQPNGVLDNYDVRKYRNVCFIHSIPKINQIIDKHSGKPLEFRDQDPGDLLIQKGKGKLNFFPFRLSLEETFRYLVQRGFQLDPNTILQAIPLLDFESDLKEYFRKHQQVLEILPDYHITLDQEIKVDEQGNFLNLPDIYSHCFVQARALERILLPHLKRISENRKWLQMSEKIQSFDRLAEEISYDTERGLERVKSLMEILEIFPINEIDDAFFNEIKEKVLQAIEILYSIRGKLPILESRKKEARYKNLFQRLSGFIRRNSVNIDTGIGGISGLNITPININREISQFINDKHERHRFCNRLMSDLSVKFACYYEKPDSRHETAFFVDHRYLQAVISNLYARSLHEKRAEPYLRIALLISSRLELSHDRELNSALDKNQIDFFNKDIENILSRKREEKKRLLTLNFFGILSALILYGLTLYYYPAFWPVIFLLAPFLVFMLWRRRKKSEPLSAHQILNRSGLDSSKGVLPGDDKENGIEPEKQGKDTKVLSKKDRYKAELEKFSSTVEKQKTSAKEKKSIDKEPTNTAAIKDDDKTLFSKDINESIKDAISALDQYWRSIIQNPDNKNIFPPDMSKLSSLLAVDSRKLTKYIRLYKKEFQGRIKSIVAGNSKAIYYISSRFYLDEREKIQNFYKSVYEIEIKEKEEPDQGRLDIAHIMIAYFSDKGRKK